MKIFLPFIFISLCTVLFFSCNIEDVYIPPEPEVRIVFPTRTTQILDSVIIQIDANDDRGISKIDLFIDNIKPPGGTLLYEPYEYNWKVENYADSSMHLLHAVAYDTDSNATQSQKIPVIVYRFSPSNLLSFIVNDTLLRFTWNDNSSRETAFELFESINDSAFVLRKTIPPNTITTDITGFFVGGDKYSYFVRAKINDQKSKNTNIQDVFVVLSPPAGLYFAAISDTVVELRWQQGTNSFEEYVEIEERIGSGNFMKRATIPSGSRVVSLPGSYKVGTNYSFRARAFTKYSISQYSNMLVTNFPFPAPTNISVLQSNPRHIKLSWKDNTTFEKGFSVERKVYGSGTFAEVFRTGPNDTSWIDFSVDTTISYQYRVRAFTDSNVSLYSKDIFSTWFPLFMSTEELSQNNSEVTSIRFRPNSAIFAAGHADGTVNIWNARSGFLEKIIKPVSDGIFAIDFNTDGSAIATGGGDGTIKIWNVNSGNLVNTIPAHTGRVHDIDFSDNGTSLASAGADGLIKLWNASTGTLIMTFTGHTDTVTSIRIHPAGTTLVSGSKDKSVRYWNATGTQRWNRSFPVSRVNAVSFNSDGNKIAVGQSAAFHNPVVVLQEATGDTASSFIWLSYTSNSVLFSPNGSTLLSVGDEGQMNVFDLTLQWVYTNTTISSVPITKAAIHSENAYFVTGNRSGNVTIWNIVNNWKKFGP